MGGIGKGALLRAGIVGFLLVVMASPGLGETPSATTEETLEDAKLRQADTDAVKAIRGFLETKYVGKVAVTPSHNREMQSYIDELMAPLESLVVHKQLSRNLAIQEVAGPTGVAKSAVAMDFTELAVGLGFLDDSRRLYQQGSADRGMDLSIIDRLGVKETELKRLAGSKKYSDVRAHFKRTYAFIHFDEATDFAKPPKDLKAAYDAELAALQETFKAKREALAKRVDPGPRPQPPKETDFLKSAVGDAKPEVDRHRYDLAHADYESALLTWQRAQKDQVTPDSGTAAEALEALDRKYERLKLERIALNHVLKKVWQATSGGRYYESALREKDEDLKVAVEKAALELQQFHARHKHDVRFRDRDQRFKDIGARRIDLQSEEAKLTAIETELAELNAKLSRFKGASGKSVEEWLFRHSRKREAGLEIVGGGYIPAFVDPMVDELRKSDTFYDSNMVLFDEKKLGGGSEDTQKIMKHILDVYQRRIEDASQRKARSLDQITRLRGQIEILIGNVKAFDKSQTESAGRSDWHDLARESDRLEEHYRDVILLASRTSAASFQIDKFIDGLDAEKLRTQFPEYFKRLSDLLRDPERVNTPEQETQVLLEINRYLSRLKHSRSVDIKFAEVMRMSPTRGMELVHDAVTRIGFQSDPEYFGNVRWLATMNLKDLERAVHADLAARRAKGEVITFDRYHKIYKEHVAKMPGWAINFFKDYWPGFFKEPANGSSPEGNPIAEARRISGPEGPLFIHPPTAEQLVNNVATTAISEFEQWKKNMRTQGFEVEGDLYVHENAATLFVTDEKQPERGANAVLDPVRKAMGALLVKLTEEAVKTRIGAGSSPSKFHVKLALVNEAKNGKVQALTLRYLEPNFAQKDAVLRTTPRFGLNSEVSSYLHTLKPAAALATYAIPPLTVVETDEKLPVTMDDYAKAEALKKEAADKEAAAQAALEKTEREREMTRSLQQLLLSQPTKEQIKEFYDTLKDPAETNFIRERILQWAVAKLNRANTTHLYHWLKFDLAANKNIDGFIDTNFAQIRKYSTYSLANEFANLVLDDVIQKKVRRLARPNLPVRAVRSMLCLVGLGRVTGIKVSAP